jgi:hypothetical protein
MRRKLESVSQCGMCVCMHLCGRKEEEEITLSGEMANIQEMRKSMRAIK